MAGNPLKKPSGIGRGDRTIQIFVLPLLRLTVDQPHIEQRVPFIARQRVNICRFSLPSQFGEVYNFNLFKQVIRIGGNPDIAAGRQHCTKIRIVYIDRLGKPILHLTGFYQRNAVGGLPVNAVIQMKSSLCRAVVIVHNRNKELMISRLVKLLADIDGGIVCLIEFTAGQSQFGRNLTV